MPLRTGAETEKGKDRERMEEEQDEMRKEDSEKGEDRKAEEEEMGRNEKDGMTVFILINFNNLHALLDSASHYQKTISYKKLK